MAIVYTLNTIAWTAVTALALFGGQVIFSASKGLGFASIPLGLCATYCLACVFGAAYARGVSSVVARKEGEFPLDDSGREAILQYLRITSDTLAVGLCRPLIPIAPWLLSILGLKAGRGLVVMGKILNADLVRAGDGVLIGDGALVTGHVVHAGKNVLRRIVLEDGVTVGVRAVVMPGVVVGRGSVIAAGAVVPIGTRIPPGEVWGGVPARFIGRVAEGGGAP